MQYEIYMDTLLLLSFMMNYMVLQLTNRFRKRSATRLWVMLGAMISSSLSSVLLLIVNLNGSFKIILMYLGIVPLVCAITWKEHRVKELCKLSITMVGMLAFMTGMLNVCYTQVGFLQVYEYKIVALSASMSLLYLVVKPLIPRKVIEVEDMMCDIVLSNGDRQVTAKGLVDTGNSLRDPISNRPVCMISNHLIEPRSVNGMTKGYCVIPYHSMGKEHGILEGYEIDQMIMIRNGMRIIHKEVLVAVVPTYLTSSNAYQIILHPQLLN